MDKYEYKVKTEQLLEYTEKKQFQKAMEIADTIDWRRVKSASMLNTVSEVYEYCGEYQKSRDILFMAFDRSPNSRKIVYRLGTLALKVNDPDEASDCYEEFVKIAPKDPNQYILKYRILKAQNAPIREQITALEEFKKEEYIERWAYELAKLYHEAGMTKECLEECDDLILWFSEGKYVYLAMELKMKYKPLTPLQQEKYDKKFGGRTPASKTQPSGAGAAKTEASGEDQDGAAAADIGGNTKVIEKLGDLDGDEDAEDADLSAAEEAGGESAPETPPVPEVEQTSAITSVVHGATLKEALASGMAIAAGIRQEEKNMAARDEELKLDGQMLIDDILQEWEEKQKENAAALERQKKIDEERLSRERAEAEKRIAEAKKAAEEAARKAEEEAAARKAAEEARIKAAEEEAERQAAEEAEKRTAERAAARKNAEETAAKKAAEKKAAEEEAARRAKKAAEEKAAREAATKRIAKEAAVKKAEEEAARKAEEERILSEKTQRLPDDIMELVEQLENRVAGKNANAAAEEAAETEALDLDEHFAEDFPVDDQPTRRTILEAKSLQEEAIADAAMAGEAEPAEETAASDEAAESLLTEEGFAEAEFEESALAEEDFEENDFEEGEFGEDNFEEEEFGEDEFEEAEFEEAEFEEADFEEADFEEADAPEAELEEADFEEADFEETDFEEADFEEADFEEEDAPETELEEADFEEADFAEEAFDEEETDGFEADDLPEISEEPLELEIEEPSEEEIQRRIKKSKGSGVPFDTGFVVTGRYDLSATSEIGLKAGLTEEQKKLFSYFVPVRGMSEQIVEVLDNDRRAQREGTSRTGNLLVIGRKGSGKTVLAVDIVKAIQKQRNLKQGKVAIVTGESLNKKELPNIIQKLRGGAIIVEKAGKLNSRTINELNHLMERKTGEMLFVLEDQRKPLERILTANPEFKKKFTSKLELPIFINDELVTFGQTYAKENGYKLDEMGILALYSRIDVMQREDHAVSVAEVKDIMDEAISHSQRANVKHLARRVFGKSTDDSDRIILKEEDFKI